MTKKTFKIFIFLLIFFFCPVLTYAKTSLWKVSSDSSAVYIGGTVHLLRSTDYPLPEEFDLAYSASDTIVLEADLGNSDMGGIMGSLAAKSMYSGGSSLETALSPETYANLKVYCDSAGMPVLALNQFKPSFVIITLQALELKKLGVTESGVDLHYYKMAVKDGKKIIGLEKMEEQMEMLLALGEGNENEYINSSIKGFKEYSKIIEESVAAWKKGDDELLYKLTVDEIEKETPDIYNELIVKRNLNWLPKIEELLNTSKKAFVLVGAGHLIGEYGIIEALKKHGYKIEKVE